MQASGHAPTGEETVKCPISLEALLLARRQDLTVGASQGGCNRWLHLAVTKRVADSERTTRSARAACRVDGAGSLPPSSARRMGVRMGRGIARLSKRVVGVVEAAGFT